MKKHQILLFMLAAVLLVACSEHTPKYATGETLLEEDFSAEEAWELYNAEGVDLMVQDGVYNMKNMDDAFIWGIKQETIYDNIVMEMVVSPMTDMDTQGAALMCRADGANTGLGYYFIIRNNGLYSISVSEPIDETPTDESDSNPFRLLADGDSGAINEGGSNTVRIVCADDYLALYVNDQFVDEVNDSTYTEGVVALAVASGVDGQEVHYTFDNAVIQEASVVGGE